MKYTVIVAYRADCCSNAHLAMYQVQGGPPEKIERDIKKRARRKRQTIQDLAIVRGHVKSVHDWSPDL